MIYVIGDIQGCFLTFQRLLALIAFQPSRDELWLVGDLVCRGPHSLETLRWVKQHAEQGCVRVVLGNHDLHLLAVMKGLRSPLADDHLSELLAAPDLTSLAAWLQRQPFLYENERFVMVHAGIWPKWSLSEARVQAHQLSEVLSREGICHEWFGNTPAAFAPSLSEIEQLRFGINSFTRMRFVEADGSLELS